jgi:hypothetical protein
MKQWDFQLIRVINGENLSKLNAPEQVHFLVYIINI